MPVRFPFLIFALLVSLASAFTVLPAATTTQATVLQCTTSNLLHRTTSTRTPILFTRQQPSATSLAAGPATLEPPTKESETKEKAKDKDKNEEATKSSAKNKKGGWAVRLFNDPMNKREFVALCLSQITGLTDGQAYQVMMAAHKNGVAVVGRYDQERAELYRDSLSENGLTVDMVPVEDE